MSVKNCPECSAVLDDNALSCPYCGSDKPKMMGYSQTYSLDDRTALIKVKIAIAIAVIALVINPFFITTFAASNAAGKIKRKCNPNNKQIAKLCHIASLLSGIAIVTSPIIFFWWFINVIVS